MWQDNLSNEDKEEMIADAIEAFHNNQISEYELRLQLGKLGLNATEIEDKIHEN